jgi:hypothetical protein
MTVVIILGFFCLILKNQYKTQHSRKILNKKIIILNLQLIINFSKKLEPV